MISLSSNSFGKTVITILSGINKDDSRHIYEKELLELALDHTRDEYGDYELRPAPSMTHARGIESMRLNKFPNFIRTFGFDPNLSEKHGFSYVKFPIHRGVTSYRTCFLPEEHVEEIKAVKDLESLKQYSYGMGLGWTDTEILKHNGFKNIAEIANYSSLFKMTALGRIDFFCRGTNEILMEYKMHKDIEGLAHDKSFSIFYPVPLLLYTNEKNKEALARIEKGLLKANQDGSLLKLWTKHYQESIDFADLESRKIYYLQSPLISDITFDYTKFFFLPPPKELYSNQK